MTSTGGHDAPPTEPDDSARGWQLHHVQRAATPVPTIITPGDLEEALEAVGRPGFKPIAGGTDLLVEIDRAQHRGLAGLVDLTRLPGLDGIGVVTTADLVGDDKGQEGDRLHLGPLVTHNRCATSEAIARLAPALAQACHEVGSPQLRNRATVAGNVVTASPANDTLTPLRVHDAYLTLASIRGRRRVSLADFHLGVRRTTLADDEIVIGVDLEPLDSADGWRSVYLKLGLRRAQAISVVHLAAAVRLDPGGTVFDARLALGSVAPTVDRMDEVEALLVGRALDADTVAAVAAATGAAATPIDDLRATARYRSDLVVEMTVRALSALADDEGLVPERPPMLWGSSEGRAPTGAEHRAEHRLDDPVVCTLNGLPTEAPWGGQNLLDWIRSTGATGTKEGCAEGECGSCTVHLDGMAVLACLVPATRATGADVVSVEGLGASGRADETALGEAFVEAGAVQCGYCIPGFLMSAAKLAPELADPHGAPDPGPTDPDPADPADLSARVDAGLSARIKAGLSGNLCRCTGYYKIEDAVIRVVLGR